MSFDMDWVWEPKRDGDILFQAECGVGVEWHGDEEGFSIHAIYFDGHCLCDDDKLFKLISADIEADENFSDLVQEKLAWSGQ